MHKLLADIAVLGIVFGAIAVYTLVMVIVADKGA